MLVLIKVNVLNYKTVKIHKYVQVLVAEILSFHNVRLLGHNGTSKPVKVPILSLALLAAVAGKLTARTTFKVLSFFGWLLTVRTNTIYTGTAHNHIVVTIVTINGVQNFTKNCLFAQRQQVRISWAWCWIFRRHQVRVTLNLSPDCVNYFPRRPAPCSNFVYGSLDESSGQS